jgi:hypothetical protein
LTLTTLDESPLMSITPQTTPTDSHTADVMAGRIAADRRMLVIVGLVCSAIVVVLSAILWHLNGPLHIERVFAGRFIRASDELEPFVAHPDRWPFAVMVSPGEPVVFVVALIAVTVLGLRKRNYGLAATACLGPLLALFVTEEIGKPLVHRMHDIHASFPSGHSTASASLATVGFLLLVHYRGVARARRWLPLFALLPAATGCGVVFLRWHYPSDSVGGIAVGIAVVVLFAVVTMRDPLGRRALDVHADTGDAD